MPNHGFSYSDILRAEMKGRRMQDVGWKGLLYLFHLPGESKATQMSSEQLVRSRAGIFYIICFPSYILYCKYWLVKDLMIIKSEKVCKK